VTSSDKRVFLYILRNNSSKRTIYKTIALLFKILGQVHAYFRIQESGKDRVKVSNHPMGQRAALFRYGSLSLFLNEREQRKRRY